MSGVALKPGDPLPAIAGETQSGHIDLASFRGKKHVVIWTYPMDDTPGCTAEAKAFTAHAADFAAADAVLVGLSKDGVESHRRFCDKYALDGLLLADPDGAVLKLLGVGTGLGGVAKRTTFIVDKDGIVRRVFEDVSVQGHADAVLAAVKEL